MSSPSEPAPQALPYASSYSANGVRVSRHADGLRIDVRATSARVTRLLLMIAALIIGAGALAYAWHVADNTALIQISVGLFGALACVGGVATLGKRLRRIVQPVTVEVDAAKVTLSRRVRDRIGRDEWQRAWVTGLRVVAAGWNEVWRREELLELWLNNGHGVGLYVGPPAAVEEVRAALCDALGVVWISREHARPRRGPSRRARVVVTPGFVEFSFKPPVVSWVNAAALLPALAVAVASLTLWRRRDNAALFPVDEWGWAVVRFVTTVTIAWVLIVCGIQYVRRKAFVSLIAGKLVAMEVSPLRPVREEWPVPEIAEVWVTGGPRGSGTLSAGLRDGRAVDLLASERVADLQWVRDGLTEIFLAHGVWKRAEPATTTVETPAPPVPTNDA